MACVAGIGGYLPPSVVTNEDLARRLDVTDDWIVSRIGVHRRHRVTAEMATSDLAVAACREAIDHSGERPGGVVLATTTPDRPCPATAPVVASRLGLGPVPAFDVAAVCTGFVYGLSAGAGLIATSALDSVLVIGADTYSAIIDPHDRVTAAIFGDGAGAILLRAGQPGDLGELGPVVLASDGSGEDLITVREGGSRRPMLPGTLVSSENRFSMQGQAVFRRAIACMTQAASDALRRAGWDVADVDCVIAHQANQRILDAVGRELGLPPDRMFSNIAEVGNTSAASIPLAMRDAWQRSVLRPGSRVLVTAFGGGLTWGAATLTWPDLGTTEDRGNGASQSVARSRLRTGARDGEARTQGPHNRSRVDPLGHPMRVSHHPSESAGTVAVTFTPEAWAFLTETLAGVSEPDLVLALPAPGSRVSAGKACGVLFTSARAVDILAPVDGTVVSRNEDLALNPLSAISPAAPGQLPTWLFEVEPLTTSHE